jgi:murein DD-endopeptidase MepM/ murein hydrolase activator NlpD
MKYKSSILIFLLFFASLIAWPPTGVYSDETRIKDLQGKINQRNQEIEEIQKEIEKYEAEINKVLAEERTLKNQIWRLQTTADKLRTEIKLTESSINTAGFIIQKLGFQIDEKNAQIQNKKDLLAEIIRQMDEQESSSLIEILLAHDSLSEFFNDLERMEDFQKDINFNLVELRALKNELKVQQEEKQVEKTNLENLHIKLGDQKRIAESNKRQKDFLLVETKNKESVYRDLLAEQVEKQKAIQNEIQDLEDQLRIEIDPTSLPPTGSGVLAWPVDNVFITQYFGSTPFATKNPQVYNGSGHNGVDFRASIGTPIKASKSGVVVAIGNTDAQCRGVSYGKWVLIEHNNNLSTLYAHLSLIKVQKGQKIALGELVGYSGNTGYVTGPHLHFGVFATQAIVGFEYKSKTCGTIMNLPIVSPNGYLNPLSYL